LYSFLSSVWVLPSMLVIWARSSGLAKNLNENMMPEAKDKYEVPDKSIAAIPNDDDSSEEKSKD